MPLDQWQALAGLHSGEAQNNLTVSFSPIGAAMSPVVPGDGVAGGGGRGEGELGKGRKAEVSAKLNKQKVLFVLVNPLQLALCY